MNDGRVCCTKCSGTGRMRLAPQRQRVLDAVRALGEASPSEVVSAVNRAANVCAWLARNGLLTALGREGKRVRYRAKEDSDA